MPIERGFAINPWLERGLKLRLNPLAGYALALLLVAAAVLVRRLAGQHIGIQQFTTFYPAVILAALFGGLWPGVLAVALSTIAAWGLSEPVPSIYGEFFLFVIISLIDVTIAVLLNKLVDWLVVQQHNIRVLLEAAPNGFVLVDENGIIKLVNASIESLFGYSRAELIGRPIEILVPEKYVSERQELRSACQLRQDVRLTGLRLRVVGRRKEGSEFPAEISLVTVGSELRPAVLATVTDITARKRAEEHQQLVIGELKHRTGNLISIMQSIIANTLKEARTTAEARYVLNGRLKSLGEAYDLLAGAWEGTSLIKILKSQPILSSGRVAITGCDVIVPPRVGQQMAMIVHELATNALKYGALSSPQGRVSILGNVNKSDGDLILDFSWMESDGPLVSAPTRKGFGSVILQDAAESLGHVTIEYRPDGLLYQLRIDLKEVDAQRKIDAGSLNHSTA